MGQFKPMVKMMTTEPTVELKLKKGGAVAMKKGGSTTKAKKMADGGDSSMAGAMMGAPRIAAGPVGGSAAPVVGPRRPSMAMRRKAMRPPMAAPMPATPMMKKGGKAHEDAAEDRAMIKKAMAGKKFATGGQVSVEESWGSYPTTKVHQAKSDNAPAKTGGVKEGNAGGYKRGGKVMKKATGGAIPSETSSGEYQKTKVYQAKPDRASGTGGVKEGNAGGYATGGVAKANAGGYKKGGSAKKFADGGSVQADGRAVKMPQGEKSPSQPVSITRLSGTFKTGGKVTAAEGKLRAAHKAENAKAFKAAKTVELDRYSKYQKTGKKMASGGDVDHASAAESEGYKRFYENEKAENEATRKEAMDAIMHPIETMKSLPGKLMKGFDAIRGAGSVTRGEREKFTTVSPGKKRGGRAC
jgi:hypothetical protein